MDLATLIGLVGAFATIGVAIVLGGVPSAFVNVPSLIVVIVGSLLVTLMKFSLGQFLGATKVAIKAFIYKVPDPEQLIAKSVELANEARQSGLLALEEAEVPDEFFKRPSTCSSMGMTRTWSRPFSPRTWTLRSSATKTGSPSLRPWETSRRPWA